MKAAHGRKAFEICEIQKKKPGCTYPYRFKVLPWPLSDLPDHAVVHEFKWDKRK